MPKLDRYLLGDFIQSFLATLIVLLTVSLGGVLVDVLGEIADGGLPARLLLSQLGLQLLVYLPLVLPLALMLGLMLSLVRLYRDSEMAVINAIGNVGSAVSPLLIGILRDATGSFSSGLWFVAGLLVVGALVLTRIPMTQRDQQRNDHVPEPYRQH